MCALHSGRSSRLPSTGKRFHAPEPLERRDLFSSQGLDPTFGNAGIIEQTFAVGPVFADAVAVQPDGKIVVAGMVANPDPPNGNLVPQGGYVLARYNADGTPDLSFGINGAVITNRPAAPIDNIQHLAIESDGKLLASGPGGLARFNANGSLDTSFGHGGVVDSAGTGWVALQSDGKIIISGGNISRYNADGTPDSTFGTNGYIEDGGGQFIITASGEIVTVSVNGMQRFTADGTLDTTFGGGGSVTVPTHGPSFDGFSTVVAAGDKLDWVGNVIVSTQTGSHDAIEVVQYNSDGTINRAFGNNGETIIVSQAPLTNTFDAVLQADGKLVIVGRSGELTSPNALGNFLGNIFTARLDAGGALDPTWGTGGMMTISIGNSSEALAATQTSDGQIVLVGDAVPLNAPDQAHALLVVRLAGDANQEFVQGVFSDLLSRPADPTALNYLSTQLDSGAVSRSQVVQILQSSPEYLQNIVREVYVQFLKRAVDPTGLSSWTSYLESGGTRQQLETEILASDEFYNQISGGDRDTFLNNLFLALLDRPIDAAGLTAFDRALSDGESRDRVVVDVLSATEFELVTVNSLYLEFLGRPAEASGLAAFASQLAAGASPDHVIAQIVESDEYLTRKT